MASVTKSYLRKRERKRRRGSRTHDGGFAIRCLSHLATAPFGMVNRLYHYVTLKGILSNLPIMRKPP